MSSAKLEWIMSVVDRSSSPADRIAGKLGLVEKRLAAVAKAEAAAKTDAGKDRAAMARMGLELQRQDLLTAKLNGETASFLGKWGMAAGIVGAVLVPIGMVGSAVAGVVDQLVRGTASLLVGFGKAAIEAASFKENNLIAFRTLLRSDEAASRMMKTLVNFAAATPFETRDIMEIGKNLLVGGFKEREIPVVLKAVGDLGAMKGFDKQVMDRLVLAMSQIKGKGRLQGGELLQLAEAGVPLASVYENLGKVFGVTAQQAQKLVSAGGVGADVGIFAVVKTIRDEISGGKLASMMGQTSQTVSGLWSTIASKPFEWMMNLDRSAGFKSLKTFLATVANVLDASQGKIVARAERLFNWMMKWLLGDFSGSNAAASVEALLDKILNGFDRLFAGVRAGAEFAKSAVMGFLSGTGLDSKLGDLLSGEMDEEKLARIGKVAGEMGEAFGRTAASIARLVEYSTRLSVIWNNWATDKAAGITNWLVGANGPSEKEQLQAAFLGKFRERLALQAGLNVAPARSLSDVTGGERSQTVNNRVTVNMAPGSSADDAAAVQKAAEKGVDESMGMWESIAMTTGALGG